MAARGRRVTRALGSREWRGAPRSLHREAKAQPGQKWCMVIAPDVAEAVADATVAALFALKQRFGHEIVIEIDPTLDRERFQIVSV